MAKRPAILVAVAAGVLAILAVAAILVGRLESPSEVTKTVEAGSNATASVVYAASFPDLSGKQQSLAQWSNKLLVINFWASWCGPCLDELPIFVKMQEKYSARGLQVIGIAADSPANVGNFAKKLNVNYPVLPDEARAIEFSKRAGNRLGLLPYTIIIAPDGDILHTRLGVVSETEIERIIQQHLPK